MHKKVRHQILVILLVIYLLPSTAFCDEDLPSGIQTLLQFTQADGGRAAQAYPLSPTDTLVAENEQLQLYVNMETANVSVVNKRTGYVWHSTVQDQQARSSLGSSWKKLSSSLLAGDFMSATSSTAKRYSMTLEGEYAPVVTCIKDGVSIKITFADTQTSCVLNLTLMDQGLCAQVPADQIVSWGNYTLNTLYVLPFFGAAYQDQIDGYIFIPDGCGALIRFRQPAYYSSPFVSRIYGKDLAYPTGNQQTVNTDDIPAVELQQLTLPVFGMTHGFRQDAFLAVIEQGDEACDLVVSAAGTVVDFTWGCARFVYRDNYWQPAGNNTGFNTVQSPPNTFDATVCYYFLEGASADYTGMACFYRQLLQEQGLLTNERLPGGDIPLKLDAVMAEQARGYWRDETRVLTTLESVKKWTNELNQAGISNVWMMLRGWQKGGISGHSLGSVKLEGKTGNESQLEELRGLLQNNGGNLILECNLSYGFEKQLNRRNMMMSVTKNLVSKNEVHGLYTTLYYTNLSDVENNLKVITKLPASINDVALQGIGRILFSNFRGDESVNRLQAKEKIIQLLSKARNEAHLLLTDKPNLYALSYVDAVYNMPVNHSMMKYETDAVPFLQIVLSGYVDCFSNPLNDGSDLRKMLLMMVDYGLYPAFVLSESYSSAFANTNSNDICSSRYEDWKEDLEESYAFINSCLSRVRGSSMVKREAPQNGLSVVTYDNGVVLLINYNQIPCEYAGVEIDAMQAMWMEE